MRGRTPQIRRILRRKRIKRAIKAYGNYIAAGLLAVVVIVFTVGAAVKPAANSLPEDTKEPEPTQPTMEAVQQEPYPLSVSMIASTSA